MDSSPAPLLVLIPSPSIPNYRIGYAQAWQLSVQRDLPGALQIVATYFGVKGTHGAQQFLPNTNPIGDADPCPGCPFGFAYRTSGGNSTRQAGQVQLRRRLRSGLTASLEYTFSKSIDDDAELGGLGYVTAAQQSKDAAQSAATSPPAAIAQNWRDLRAERALSTFDQRNLLSFYRAIHQRRRPWRRHFDGRLARPPAEGVDDRRRADRRHRAAGDTHLSRRRSRHGIHLDSSAPALPARPFMTPAPAHTSMLRHIRHRCRGSGELRAGTRLLAPTNSHLNSSLARTFRPHGKLYLDLRVDATNILNHAAFTSWNAIVGSTQFGLPVWLANPMRSLQTTSG